MFNLIDVYDDTQPDGVRKHAIDYLYQIVKERLEEPDNNISHSMLPTMAQHVSFVTSKPYQRWFLIEQQRQEGHDADSHGALWVGYISATFNNEIGIILQRHARGQGLGRAVVRFFTLSYDPMPASPSARIGRWLANISPKNERSRRMFTGLGFVKMQETFELTQEAANGNRNQEETRTA